MSPLQAGLYRKLATEQPNPRSRRLDREDTLTIVRRINQEDRRASKAVARELSRIAEAADLIAERLQGGGKIVLTGAGSSGRLCVMEAAECPPTFGISSEKIQAVMAGGRSSVFRSREGAEDDAEDGGKQILRRVRPGDVVIGVAASGITPFVRGALKVGKESGCRTLLITSNANSPVPEADILIRLRVGPEMIAGSTRLKSATAAKLVLNTLTTTAMIRLGKVYDGWMVDLKPTSRKLKLRSVRIVSQLGGLGVPAARDLLRRCGGVVKLAVLAAKIARGKVSERILKAERLLRAFDGSLALAMGFLAEKRR